MNRGTFCTALLLLACSALALCPGPSPAAFTWTVLQDAGHPVVLTLPVVGTAGEQLPRLTVTQQ